MHVTLDARYYRAAPSGIGEYTRALAERLPRLAGGDRFTYWVSPTAPSRPLAPTAPGNVEERVVRPGPNSLRTIVAAPFLGDTRHTDVLHLPFNILGLGISCPTVVTMHDVMWLVDPRLLQARWLHRRAQSIFYGSGARRALRRATRVITVSRASADWIEKLVPEAAPRLRVIPLAAHERFVPPDDPAAARARAAAIVGEERPFLLVVGRNAAYKWHEGVVRAMAELVDRDALLVLVQRLEPGGPLARLARELGVEHRVRWLPARSPDEVVTLMQGAVALVQPSVMEGFGLPVLEAMACGTPVVASDAAALVEVAGGAALHVEREPRALAAAMDEVIADAGLRADLAARGLARAAQLSWDRVARETLEVYREAAS
jgi:glycosyltransferase involved in cell wall biosynthesis